MQASKKKTKASENGARAAAAGELEDDEIESGDSGEVALIARQAYDPALAAFGVKRLTWGGEEGEVEEEEDMMGAASGAMARGQVVRAEPGGGPLPAAGLLPPTQEYDYRVGYGLARRRGAVAASFEDDEEDDDEEAGIENGFARTGALAGFRESPGQAGDFKGRRS